jgi:hypothetical protein
MRAFLIGFGVTSATLNGIGWLFLNSKMLQVWFVLGVIAALIGLTGRIARSANVNSHGSGIWLRSMRVETLPNLASARNGNAMTYESEFTYNQHRSRRRYRPLMIGCVCFIFGFLWGMGSR